jgi:TRAP-type C4-dicarboxylate transport system permease small subunit
VLKTLQFVTQAFAALILLAIVLVLSGQVFSRYALSLSLSWPEEVSRYLFVWLVFIGGAAAVGAGESLVVDSFTELAPPALRRTARIVAPAGALLGIGILLYTCMPLLLGPASRTASPASGITLFWVYLAVPVGCAITAVFLFNAMLSEMRA